MSQETVSLKAPDGASSTAMAEIVRRSPTQRAIWATIYAVGGCVGGAACIIIPVLHLITTWALPLVGILMAMRTMRREVMVTRVEGRCPACSQEINDFDRGGDDPMWQICPRCGAKLQIVSTLTPPTSA